MSFVNSEDEIPIGTKFGDYTLINLRVGSRGKYIVKCSICGHIRKLDSTRLKYMEHSQMVCRGDFIKGLIGQTINNYRVLEYLGHRNKNDNISMFNCKCGVCGREQVISKNSLLESNRSHHNHCIKICKFKYKDELITRYENIVQRTTNPNNTNYQHYGGRGIENKFKSSIDFIDCIKEKFLLAVEKYPNEDINTLQIDRIDNNGHYECSNLRIIRQIKQMSNTRANYWFIAKKNNKKVVCNNAMYFGREFGINGRSVGNCLRGDSKQTNGWVFRKIGDSEAEELVLDEEYENLFLLNNL